MSLPVTFSFDLISDLHVDTWDNFDWINQATSPYCVVAGDVARDAALTKQTLQHLSQCYQGVFYIDGNDEHRFQLANLEQSYDHISHITAGMDNVVYLQNNVVIINGVALLATNGWWTYDFDATIDTDLTCAWLQQRYGIDHQAALAIQQRAYNDVAYLRHSVERLQTHQEVKAIAVITHTVPGAWLVNHDLELSQQYRLNTMGNSHIDLALESDTEHKVKVWCFGHYHRPVDRTRNGVRYVNNCRGRGDTNWCSKIYYPKKICVEF